MPTRRYIQCLALMGVMVAIQMAASLSGSEYYLTQLTMAAYYSLLIIGLCLLMGYAGQISLGHAGFFAIGGYTSAVLTTHDLGHLRGGAFVDAMERVGLLVSRHDLYGAEILHVHPWAAGVSAVLITVLIAYLIGGPVLKLKGHYLAMATLGFGTIIYRIVLGTAIFGEADGLSEVPALGLLPGLEVSGAIAVRVQNYYIAWVLLIVGLMLLLNLIDSRVGRALRGIHGAEDASEAVGVNTARHKLNAFVISAAFAAVAGVFLTHYNGGIGPSEAGIMKSVRYVAIVAIGGMANLWGALVMGVVLNFLSLRGYFGSMDDAVFGGILIAMMLFAPDGLLRMELLSTARKFFGRAGQDPGEAAK